MVKAKMISVWVGNFEDYHKLRDYKAQFDWYGNFVYAEFAKNFGLSCNDLDKMHLNHNDTKTKPNYKDVKSLLKFFGISEKNVPQFEELLAGGMLDKFNSIIMVYDCDYKGNVTTDGKMEFIGCVTLVDEGD